LGTEVESVADQDLSLCAARDGDEAAVMLTRFCVEDNESAEDVQIKLDGFGSCTAELYLLDEENDLTLVRTEQLGGEVAVFPLRFTPQSAYLIKLKK
jgi:CO dehydrogenase/acetyl-CoA synthase alpha subunit